jgi:hypothetical protein
MLRDNLIRYGAGLLALVAAPLLSAAQDLPKPAQTGPALKTVGVPTNAKPEVVPSLIVMNSQGAILDGDKLTLTGVAPNVIIFADRPVRSAGHALTSHVLEEWDPTAGADSFAKNPPNATVSAFDKEASTVKDVVVEMTSPKVDGANIVFTVKVLEGDLNGADGPASVFIDIIGMPRTPLSLAGVARRSAYRGAFYQHGYAGYGYHPHYGGYHPYPGAGAVLGAAAMGAMAAGAYGYHDAGTEPCY